MTNISFIFFLFSLALLFPQYAYTYIEPGVGSLLIQALFGGFIGGIVILKSYWYKISNFFSSKNSNNSK